MGKYSEYYNGADDLVKRLDKALDHYLQARETADEIENVIRDAISYIEENKDD